MSANHNIPPGGTQGAAAQLNAHIAQMNINAQPFVPNVQAQQFVPIGGGIRGYPYSGYPMHAPGMGPPGMYHHPHHGYGVPPQHMPHQGGYMMGGHGGIPSHHSGMPHQQSPRQQQQPIPVSALEGESLGSSHHQSSYQPQPQSYVPSTSSTSSQRQPYAPQHKHHPDQQLSWQQQPHPQQKQQQQVTELNTSARSMDSLASGRGQSSTAGELLQDDPVDSWEDIADSADTSQVGVADGHVPTKKPNLETGKIINQTNSQSSKPSPSSAASNKESGNHSSLATGATSSASNGNGRKHPSPNLSEKKPGRSESKQAAAAAMQLPPPKTEDDKENLNIVFIGHVDAGKSTIGGHVMYLTGQVDKRTLEKYEREAKEKNRETWYLSWALDTNQEERDKGKTVEVGRACFETDKKRFTILDAPGHAGFVPNMISGAAQADIGVLVISARKGEFETGFERRGQTREHAMLAKTAGVKHLVVLINKMDDPTVLWSEERYDECKTKLTPFLKKVGFNPKTDIYFIPVSGLTGVNLKDPASNNECPWYSGRPFIPYLDELPAVVREDTGPLRMPISDKYKDMGTVVLGKVESGGVMKGASFLLMPNRVTVEVLGVLRVEEEVSVAYSGDNVKLRLKGIEEEDILPGFVLCDPSSPCHVGQRFEAQIVILEHKSIICAGYSAVLHIHSVVEEVQITQLKALIDRKTGKVVTKRPRFVKQDQVVIAVLQTSGVICLETFKDFPQMARFTLRDEGKTIAIGKVLKLIE